VGQALHAPHKHPSTREAGCDCAHGTQLYIT
jgi:hypothetical protein